MLKIHSRDYTAGSNTYALELWGEGDHTQVRVSHGGNEIMTFSPVSRETNMHHQTQHGITYTDSCYREAEEQLAAL